MEGFRRIESPTSSESSAPELTREKRSPGFAHQEQGPSLDSLVTESTSIEWTDEKHSLYLKSMEASFVNQLYDSMNFLGWNSKKEKLPGSKSSRQTHCTSSGQFKVLRGGCWKKINFEKPRFQLNKKDDSHCFVAGPWIQHFRSGSKSRVLASCSLQDSASSKEVSDQNFVDEEQGEKASNECGSKKLKTLVSEASCNDQVNPPLAEVAECVPLQLVKRLPPVGLIWKKQMSTASESSLFDHLMNIWEFNPGPVPGT